MKITFLWKFLLFFALLGQLPTIFPMQQCNTCSKTRSNANHKKTTLDHLMKTHSQCPWCKDNIQQFSEKIDLLKHVKVQHPYETIYSCPSCLFFSVRPYEVRKHIGLTDKLGNQSCYETLKIFFNNHLPKIHSYSCYYCIDNFLTEIEVMSHYLFTHNIWLFDILEIIDDAASNNSIGINIQCLQNRAHANNNNNQPAANTPRNIVQENSDYYLCDACKSMFPSLSTFLQHFEKCQTPLLG